MAVKNVTTVNVSGSPPIAGNVVLAQGSSITLSQVGSQITIAAAAGGAGNTGQATVAFGGGALEASIAVTGQASIAANSKIQAQAVSTDDSAWVDGLVAWAGNIIAGTGFTLFVQPRVGRAFGSYPVNWSWS